MHEKYDYFKHFISNFNSIINVNKSSKPLIDSYINHVQNQLFTSSPDPQNTMVIIPELVRVICFFYYCHHEYFEDNTNKINELKSKKIIKISDNKMNIELIGDCCWENSIYGTQIIPSNSNIICEWKLKINIECNIDDCIIGITSNNNDCNKLFCNNNLSENYCLRLNDGKKRGNGSSWTPHYNKCCYKNDIIGMKLNLRNKTLSYSHNGENIGIAFTNVKCSDNVQYRLAVGMYYELGWSIFEDDKYYGGCELVEFIVYHH